MTLPSDLLSLETERSDRQLNVQSVIQCKMGVDFGGTLCKPFRDLKLAACDSSLCRTLCGELLRVVAPHSALLQGIGLNEFFPLGKFREILSFMVATREEYSKRTFRNCMRIVGRTISEDFKRQL